MLNKQGPGTMIDWTDWSWNPISGCNHGCSYCYLNKMERFGRDMFKVRYHPDYFEKMKRVRKVKPGDKIFTGSSGDMWGEWVPDEWINKVILSAFDNPIYTYQFLTKNPKRYKDYDEFLPDWGWYGTTFDGTSRTIDNIVSLINALPDKNKFVSFEPLLCDPIVTLPYLFHVQWIIIGADSNKGAKRPPKKWADWLIETARHYNIPVWMKDNYGYPEKIKEFPK